MPKQQMLYITPHNFFPPMNGGQLRIYHLLKSLAQQFTITLLYHETQPENYPKLVQHFPNIHFVAVNLTKQQPLSKYQKLKLKLHYGIGKPLSTFNGLVYYQINNVLNKKQFDYVFFEHLESLQAAGKIAKQHYPAAKRIINLHNIDHELWLSQYHTQPHKKELLRYSQQALQLEKKLHNTVHLALVCSITDQQKIEKLNPRKLNTLVVPNGTQIPQNIPQVPQKPNSLLFVGAIDFFPNIEGLRWFVEKVWPLLIKKIPQIQLTVVGRGNRENLSFISHPQIHIVGEVENVSAYYFNHQISIVPLLHGSGTRLKIPEAMAHGVPVVSTSKGAEGHPLQNNLHFKLADKPEQFADAISELLNNKQLYKTIQTNAQTWVKQHLDWHTISNNLVEKIHEFSRQ